jgi:hypothetical protein
VSAIIVVVVVMGIVTGVVMLMAGAVGRRCDKRSARRLGQEVSLGP